MADTVLNVPLTDAEIPKGQVFNLFFPGIAAFEAARMGSTLHIKTSDSKDYEVTVQNRTINALVNLIPQYGSMFAPCVGKPYDAVAIGDWLDKMYPENERASSVSEMYTVLVIGPIAANYDPAMYSPQPGSTGTV